MCKSRQANFKASQEASAAAADPEAAATALDRHVRDVRAFALHHADGAFANAVWHALDLFENPENRFKQVLMTVLKRRPKETEAGKLFQIKDSWAADISSFTSAESAVREMLMRWDARQKKQGNIGVAMHVLLYDGKLDQGV